MARCEANDGKFAALGELTTEVESEDISGDELQVTVRCVRPCEGCGQDQATTSLEFTLTIDHSCPDEEGEDFTDETELNGETIADRTYSVDGSVEAEPLDEYQRTDRHGKPILRSRYQRHMLGAAVTATVTCSRCGQTIDVTDRETVQASGFEDEGAH